MFEMIGLISPPIGGVAALYSSDDDEDDETETETEEDEMEIHRRYIHNGELIMLDTQNQYENGNLYSDEDRDDDDEYNHNIDGIGVSSYIRTEGVDMIDNVCLPQLMLKYNPNRYHNPDPQPMIKRNNFNIMHHLKNIARKGNNNNGYNDQEMNNNNVIISY